MKKNLRASTFVLTAALLSASLLSPVLAQTATPPTTPPTTPTDPATPTAPATPTTPATPETPSSAMSEALEGLKEYKCADDVLVSVEYGADFVDITFKEENFTLEQKEAASGLQYENTEEKLVWFTKDAKGEEGYLEKDGAKVADVCKVVTEAAMETPAVPVPSDTSSPTPPADATMTPSATPPATPPADAATPVTPPVEPTPPVTTPPTEPAPPVTTPPVEPTPPVTPPVEPTPPVTPPTEPTPPVTPPVEPTPPVTPPTEPTPPVTPPVEPTPPAEPTPPVTPPTDPAVPVTPPAEPTPPTEPTPPATPPTEPAAPATTSVPDAAPVDLSALEGTIWSLYYLTAEGKTQTVPATARPTLGFAGGKLNANTGCNDASGDLTAQGSEVEVGVLLSTKKACTDPAAQQLETDLLAALEGMHTPTVRDYTGGLATLTLRKENGTFLVLVKNK